MFSWYVLNVNPMPNYFCAFMAFILLPNIFFSDSSSPNAGFPTRLRVRVTHFTHTRKIGHAYIWTCPRIFYFMKWYNGETMVTLFCAVRPKVSVKSVMTIVIAANS